MNKILIIIVILALNAQIRHSKFCSKYISAKSIQEFLQNENSIISPEILNCGELQSCTKYLYGSEDKKNPEFEKSVFGMLGYLSSLGPLSQSGPGLELSEEFIEYQGELKHWLMQIQFSQLEENGKLGDEYFFDFLASTQENDFYRHQHGLGLFSIFGPLGFFGPLGQFGGRGPLSFQHDLLKSPLGEFLNEQRQEIRYTDINLNCLEQDFDEIKNNKQNIQNWPLYEVYQPQKAKQLSDMKQLDTSFMVYGAEGDLELEILSEKGWEFVSIIVVPIMEGEQFVLKVSENENSINQQQQQCEEQQQQCDQILQQQQKEKIMIVSDSKELVNWVQLDIDNQEQTRFKIEVNGYSMFNLHVVGSNSYIRQKQHTQYDGSYIRDC